jgi:triacylglycerol esterase/lipase EstA (alpha/beta hydrolase family)
VPAGGFSGDIRLNSVERYNPVNREWQMLAPMRVARSNMAAVAIRNTVLVIGGYSGQSIDNAVELYDIFQDRWYKNVYTNLFNIKYYFNFIYNAGMIVHRYLQLARH